MLSTKERIAMRRPDVLAKWRGRDGRARASNPVDLRAGRPEAPPKGLPCERCESEWSADDLEILYGTYVLCPECARLHRGLALACKRVRQLQAGASLTWDVPECVGARAAGRR